MVATRKSRRLNEIRPRASLGGLTEDLCFLAATKGSHAGANEPRYHGARYFARMAAFPRTFAFVTAATGHLPLEKNNNFSQENEEKIKFTKLL